MHRLCLEAIEADQAFTRALEQAHPKARPGDSRYWPDAMHPPEVLAAKRKSRAAVDKWLEFMRSSQA